MTTSASKRPTPRKKRLARIALLLGIGSVLAAAAAEVSLRVLNAWLHPSIYVLDDQLGWRLTPTVDRTLRDETGREVRFVTDTHGARVGVTAPAPKPKPKPKPAPKRVLFLGDSFTQGSDVESKELFTSLLATAIDGIEVINGGVGGYSTVQQLIAFESWNAIARPDLVVLVVYENDFADNLMPYFGGLGPRPFVSVTEASAHIVRETDPTCFEPFLQPAPAAFWLYQNSAIYRSVHKNLFLPAHGESLGRREEQERRALPQAAMKRAMATALRQLAATVEGAGSKLVVTAIPRREGAIAGSARFHPWLASYCRERKLPFLSLLDTLREAPAAAAYFANDIHFTVIGHARTARALKPFLERHLRPD